MKIGELVKRTGVPKETIHFYIREGLLRKPHKSGINTAQYHAGYVDQILLIKGLRDNYHLPIPEIKQIVKNFSKQSPLDKAVAQYQSRFSRPVDRLMTQEIEGKDAFLEATGLGRKWLAKAEEWGVITPDMRDPEPVYSPDDVAIGRLMVDMDDLGFGPKDGHDPEDLKYLAMFVRDDVSKNIRKYYESNLEKLVSKGFAEKAGQFHEVMSLFYFHLYRKFARKTTLELLSSESREGQKEAQP
ncbi:MAG: MerR family transcriptional regulator [Deltaproteobacteria bacterium]